MNYVNGSVLRFLPFLVAAVLAGCGASQSTFDDDLLWLERFGEWIDRYDRATARAGELNVAVLEGGAKVGELEAALRPLHTCRESFDRDVGSPPGSRFDRAVGLVRQFCGQLGLAGDSLAASFHGDPSDNAYEAERRFSKVTELYLQMDGAIADGLAANGRLPVVDSVTSRSHVDPRLSRIASRRGLRKLEVRCWGTGDWTTIVREWRAYYGRRTDLVGFADFATNRIHLAPNVCRGLAKLLVAGPARPAAGVDLADEVQTFAHEIEHFAAPAYEDRIECAAMQHLEEVARELVTDPGFARRLARTYWEEDYPTMPAEYVSSQCRDRGGYDIRPETSRWP
jgi:hypothetical protein